MTTKKPDARLAEQLLSVEAAADRLDTTVRFIRRLIAERRIEFVHVGRHVRISESAGRLHRGGKGSRRSMPQPCGPN
jgi:excisionase family DNA binding protein